MSDETTKYIERHRTWQDKAIEQLSFANNFLLAISTGFMAYVVDKKLLSGIKFCLHRSWEMDKSLTFYSISLAFNILSIVTGIFVLISRLYDFRLSRHITLVRQRFYIMNNENISLENKNAAILSHTDFDPPNFCQRIKTIFKLLFVKIRFLNKSEIETLKANFPNEKFKKIREFSYRLGFVSWKWTKLQGVYFMILPICWTTFALI